MLSVAMLSVAMLSVKMLSVKMLSVKMLSVAMLSVEMLCVEMLYVESLSETFAYCWSGDRPQHAGHIHGGGYGACMGVGPMIVPSMQGLGLG